jgi:hypothetical protein
MGQILQVQMSVSNLSYDFRLEKLLFRTLKKKANVKYNLNEKSKVYGPDQIYTGHGAI